MEELISKILVIAVFIYGFKTLLFGGRKSSCNCTHRGVGFFELLLLGGFNIYIKLIKLLVFLVFFIIFLFWIKIYL